MMSEEVLSEARRQIGVLLRNIRTSQNMGTKALSMLTGMSETQILDIELNRRNYSINNFLKVIQALDLYFSMSEKEGHHLDFERMRQKSDPEEAAL